MRRSFRAWCQHHVVLVFIDNSDEHDQRNFNGGAARRGRSGALPRGRSCCGYGSTHTDSLYQDVTIPSNATSATLTFWLHVDSSEAGKTQHDKLQVRIGSTTLETYSNLNRAAGFTQKSFNLISYKGKTIRIS